MVQRSAARSARKQRPVAGRAKRVRSSGGGKETRRVQRCAIGDRQVIGAVCAPHAARQQQTRATREAEGGSNSAASASMPLKPAGRRHRQGAVRAAGSSSAVALERLCSSTMRAPPPPALPLKEAAHAKRRMLRGAFFVAVHVQNLPTASEARQP